MHALVLGRFHAVTKAQATWLEGLTRAPVDRIVCVLTSANHANTRRNPLDVATRETLVRPALERSHKPFDLVRVDDIAESSHWVEHVVECVTASTGLTLTAANTHVYSANHDVDRLFRAQGFTVVSQEVLGLTPHELVQRIVDGKTWHDDASPETVALYSKSELTTKLTALFSQKLVNDDGELGHARDFSSYGAQMDAALAAKLEDLLPYVKPGCIVDKGCGTGKLLVELSKRFPQSRLAGVDLSREFLRRCDENTYATDDVTLVFGDIAQRNLPDASASSIIFSSVMHEVYSYNGYQRRFIEAALEGAHAELAPGGHLLIRDGISPLPATWRMRFLTREAKETFERFATEFRHGQGVRFERLPGDEGVRLASHDANEYLCKKDYLKNWHIEVHEEFGVFTLVEWRALLEKLGFEPVHLAEYVSGWISAHRYEGQVALTDDAGRALPWPATNAVIVGRARV